MKDNQNYNDDKPQAATAVNFSQELVNAYKPQRTGAASAQPADVPIDAYLEFLNDLAKRDDLINSRNKFRQDDEDYGRLSQELDVLSKKLMKNPFSQKSEKMMKLRQRYDNEIYQDENKNWRKKSEPNNTKINQ